LVLKKYRAFGLAPRTAIVFGLASWLITATGAASGPGWYTNFDQALAAARQQGRPVFVDFSTSWCSVCKQMDRTTLADPAVLGRLENFVKVKVDGDAFPQLCQAYGVEAYPTFVQLDPQGRMVEKRVGAMRVQEMAGTLDNTLRSVSTSMAVARARHEAEVQRKTEIAKASDTRTQLASAESKSASRDRSDSDRPTPRELEPVNPRMRESAEHQTREVAMARTDSAGSSLYNIQSGDRQLQGSSVYAAEPSGNSQRRSRFGAASDQENSSLKQLAEKTAQPGVAGETAAQESKKGDEKDSSAKAPASTAEKATAAQPDTKKPSVEQREVVSVSTKDASTAAPASESPVISSRLSGLSVETLPKPLLARSSSGASEAMASPAFAVSSAGGETKITTVANENAGAMSTGRRDDMGAASPVLERKTVEIAAASPVKSSENKLASKSVDAVTKADNTKTASAAKPEEKTSKGATRSDIFRWMKDADTKLVESHKTQSVQRKKEARAMYNKVVEKDPENKFGKSDIAYVKMVSLIVDSDSDLLRRQAYNKIKEFETRFPDSGHKDYYTLIRAILAADLGENSEAQKLLGNYSERFPDSKYIKAAQENYKSLPSSGKSSKSAKSSADSSRRKSKNRDS